MLKKIQVKANISFFVALFLISFLNFLNFGISVWSQTELIQRPTEINKIKETHGLQPFNGTAESIATSETIENLAQILLPAPYFEISNVSFVGDPVQAGRFDNFQDIFNQMPTGVILSTGNVEAVAGPNQQGNTTSYIDPDIAIDPFFHLLKIMI